MEEEKERKNEGDRKEVMRRKRKGKENDGRGG